MGTQNEYAFQMRTHFQICVKMRTHFGVCVIVCPIKKNCGKMWKIVEYDFILCFFVYSWAHFYILLGVPGTSTLTPGDINQRKFICLVTSTHKRHKTT